MEDLKRRFILQAMQDYLDQLEQALPVSIRKKKIGKTQDLINSIRTRAAASGEGATGRLIFAAHGRMVDMGVGRRHPLGGIKKVTLTLLSQRKTGIATARDNTRKPKKWYSPVVYAKLEFLESRLLYGFTEEAKAELQKMSDV
jgi:hypothetical protein